ncbi:MAG: hypothetical protein F4087_08560 [Gemmatimonadetes bacterium]|nr:hypothetical protein [Gemmatimonadota bacterium]MYA11830.1 hypothetical protein [Gemmatimonadota bacterium]MYD14497.1 hypothetical protein [Gemmatimonadota bacterium]MYE71372.1 hypothetical protein [Gemmatimonadota bacterium]MYI64825.1 hypothetical protein [Gemmatimonadota bacterium]
MTRVSWDRMLPAFLWVCITASAGCGEPLGDTSFRGANGGGITALVPRGYTGVTVVANAFSCALGLREIDALNSLHEEGVPVETILVAEREDSASVALAAEDLGLRMPYRAVSGAELSGLGGTGPFGLPVVALFRRGRLVMTIGGETHGAVATIRSLLK